MSKLMAILQSIKRNLIEHYLFLLLILFSLFSLLFEFNSWPTITSVKLNYVSKQVTKPFFLIKDPTNLIEKLASYMIYFSHLKNFNLIEIIFSLITLVNILVVYKIFKGWFNQYLGFFSAIVIGSSLIYLYELRFVNYFGQLLIILPLFFLIKNVLNHRQISNSKLYLISILAWLIFLTPTGIFYIIVLILTSFKNLKYHFFEISNLVHKLFLILINLLFLGFNLIVYLVNKSYWMNLTGFNIANLKLLNTVEAFKNLTVGSHDHNLIIQNLPLLNIFILIMLVLGLCYLIINFKNSNRSRTLLILFVVSSVITTFNLIAGLIVLTSLSYYIAITGIVYFLQTWLKHFPYNTLAKILAYSLIIVLISFSTIYSFREFFVVFKYSHDYLTLL